MEYTANNKTITALRVTSAQSFEECPAKWFNENFVETERRDSPYATIGTAVHAIIERFLIARKAGEQAFAIIDKDENWSKIPNADERKNLRKYLDLLDKREYEIIATEYEFSFEMYPGYLPILGHIDLILFDKTTNTIIVWDHKTNRGYEGVEVWRHKLQPRLYTMAVRRMFPEAKNIRFVIGYVNLVTTVEWTITEEDDLVTFGRCGKIYGELERNQFETRIGTGCQYCSLRSTCLAFSAQVTEFKEDAIAKLESSGMSNAEKYLKLKQVVNLAKGYMLSTEIALMEEIKDSGGKIVCDGQEFTNETGSARKLDVNDVLPIVLSALNRDEEEIVGLRELLPEIFTAKLGCIDELKEPFPELARDIASKIITVSNKESSLKVTKIKSVAPRKIKGK